MWSKDAASCVVCGTVEIPCMAKGTCKRCYLRAYRKANREHIAKQKREWHEKFVAGTDRGKIARETKHFDGKREEVLTRDGFKCVNCGSSQNLVVHHKDGQGRGSTAPNNDLENLQTMCRGCHINTHRTGIMAAKAKNGYRHPCINRWSRHYDACRLCNRTDIHHSAHGYCRTCIYYYKKTLKI